MADESDTVPVTGQVVFWALSAVVLSAATQRSFTAEEIEPELKDSQLPLTAYRTSPLICLCDIVHELFDIYRYLRRTNSSTVQEGQTQSQDHGPRRPTQAVEDADQPTGQPVANSAEDIGSICLKLALFVLAALPQIIKLFALQGVPVAQCLAAIFMIAILVHAVHYMVVGLSGTSSSTPKHTMLFIADRESLCIGLLQLHCLFYAHIWPYVSIRILTWCMERHESIVHGITWFSLVLTLVYILALVVLTLLTPCFDRTSRPPAWICYATHTAFGIGVLISLANLQYEDKESGFDNFYQLYADTAFESFRRESQLYAIFVPAVLGPAMACVALSAGLFWLANRLLGSRTADSEPLLPILSNVGESQTTTHTAATIPPAKYRYLMCDREGGFIVRRSWSRYLAFVARNVSYSMARCWTPFNLVYTAMRYVGGLQAQVRWLGVLFFNLATAALYFMVAFDGTGTVNPGWTGVFG